MLGATGEGVGGRGGRERGEGRWGGGAECGDGGSGWLVVVYPRKVSFMWRVGICVEGGIRL